tara:strand:- start:813 stop:2816 length:2004 start_codon:yes stop_codon:yes gene_type:complete
VQGKAFLWGSIIHTLAHLARWSLRSAKGSDFAIGLLWQRTGLSGLIAVLLLLVAVIPMYLPQLFAGKGPTLRGPYQRLQALRQRRSSKDGKGAGREASASKGRECCGALARRCKLTFEARHWLHLLVVPMLVVLCYHHPNVLAVCAALLVIWAADRAYLLLFKTRRIEDVAFTRLADGSVQMRWRNLPGMRPQPGEYVRVMVPALGWELHPFSTFEYVPKEALDRGDGGGGGGDGGSRSQRNSVEGSGSRAGSITASNTVLEAVDRMQKLAATRAQSLSRGGGAGGGGGGGTPIKSSFKSPVKSSFSKPSRVFPVDASTAFKDNASAAAAQAYLVDDGSNFVSKAPRTSFVCGDVSAQDSTSSRSSPGTSKSQTPLAVRLRYGSSGAGCGGNEEEEEKEEATQMHAPSRWCCAAARAMVLSSSEGGAAQQTPSRLEMSGSSGGVRCFIEDDEEQGGCGVSSTASPPAAADAGTIGQQQLAQINALREEVRVLRHEVQLEARNRTEQQQQQQHEAKTEDSQASCTYTQVLICPFGDWTRALSSHVKRSSESRSAWVSPCWVQGPFMSPFTTDWLRPHPARVHRHRPDGGAADHLAAAHVRPRDLPDLDHAHRRADRLQPSERPQLHCHADLLLGQGEGAGGAQARRHPVEARLRLCQRAGTCRTLVDT